MPNLKPLPSHEPTLDELLADAKRVLGQESVAGNPEDFQKAAQAEVAASHRLSPLGRGETYGKIAKDTAVGAALPAAFLGGPAGMVAGGVLSLDSLNRAVQDPSLAHGTEAALSLLPFAGPTRNLMRAGREAKVVNGLRDTFGAGDMGATVANEVPYRMGGSVQSAAEGPLSSAPETMIQRARAQVAKIFGDRAGTPPASPNYGRTAQDTLSLPEQARTIEDMGARTRGQMDVADQFGPGAAQEHFNVGQRYGGTKVEVNPAPSFEEKLGTAQSTGYGPDAKREVEQYLKKIGFTMGPEMSPVASHVPAAAAEPAVTRVPMGVHGDEFAGVQPYGPETQLTPEEAAAQDEFWTNLMHSFGSR